MTKAKMDWRKMTLELEGHARSAPVGQDIVCAAISILTQSLVNALTDLGMKYNMSAVEWYGSEIGRASCRERVLW